MFETITPIDNSVLVKREYATEEDIEKSLSNSYAVREHWKNISLEERKKSVLNFVEIFFKKYFFTILHSIKVYYENYIIIYYHPLNYEPHWTFRRCRKGKAF